MANDEERKEGLIEFQLAYEHDLKHNIKPYAITIAETKEKQRKAMLDGDMLQAAQLGMTIIHYEKLRRMGNHAG